MREFTNPHLRMRGAPLMLYPKELPSRDYFRSVKFMFLTFTIYGKVLRVKTSDGRLAKVLKIAGIFLCFKKSRQTYQPPYFFFCSLALLMKPEERSAALTGGNF